MTATRLASSGADGQTLGRDSGRDRRQDAGVESLVVGIETTALSTGAGCTAAVDGQEEDGPVKLKLDMHDIYNRGEGSIAPSGP